MATLARRVGLGLAARGDVADTVKWAERARSAGLESIWFHDSYFERDAVTYATAVAAQVEDLGIGLGALNPFTRHPVLIAMTISALDEIAPQRIRLGLGSALPLRLGQMGIPYAPEDAVRRSSEAIDTLHTLWKGERMPSGKPGLPPLQPMFPPVHRVPIYVAGYRSPVMVLAGQKGDGYLARPAESIPGLRKLLRVMNKAAREAGRDPNDIDVAGYLLTLIGDTRLDALNRAKREPFVIYMMSILSDVTLKRAGFEPQLRDHIAAAWRKEDYTTAGGLIPDDLLDAFILCGTRREVADRAWEYHEAGMRLPLLQPVVQDEDQVSAVLEAAVAYGTAEGARSGRARRSGRSGRARPRACAIASVRPGRSRDRSRSPPLPCRSPSGVRLPRSRASSTGRSSWCRCSRSCCCTSARTSRTRSMTCARAWTRSYRRARATPS